MCPVWTGFIHSGLIHEVHGFGLPFAPGGEAVWCGSVVQNGRKKQSKCEQREPHDIIDVSSLTRQGISEKAAQLYELGHSLGQISNTLDVPKTTVRETLIECGVTIRKFRRRHKNCVMGTAPFGYAVTLGKLVEDPREQKTVRFIMSQWHLGKGFRDIARTLNVKKTRSRNDKSWDHSVVRSIIKREIKTEGGTNHGN